MWDRDGTPRALPPLAGDEDSVTTDINNYGQAAGYSVNVASFVDNEFTAVASDRNGAVTALLPLPGYTQSRAEGITTRGGFTVAGTSFGDGARAVVWDLKGDGTPRALALLSGDTNSAAIGINERGQVVGSSDSTAVLWDRTGTPTALPPLPGDTESFANAINNAGHVVGTSFASDGTGTAVLWSRRGRSYEMPIALSPLPGDTESFANDISARGQVVGYSVTPESANAPLGVSTAVVWVDSSTPTALPNLPEADEELAIFDRANGINARGHIVGSSSLFQAQEDFVVIWR